MTSPAVRAVVEQLSKVIEGGDLDTQVPALRTIGNLARMFPTRESSIVKLLSAQLANTDPLVAIEAALALQKFTTSENYLSVVHSKTILEASGTRNILRLLSVGEQSQIPALILLSQVALHAGDDDTLKSARVLQILEASSRLPLLMQVPSLSKLIPLAIETRKLYQAGSHHENGFMYSIFFRCSMFLEGNNLTTDWMAIYISACFFLDESAIKILDKLWNRKEGNGKICLASWDKCTMPKNQGGLGIVDIRLHSVCLVCKWWVRMLKGEGDHWASILQYNIQKVKQVLRRNLHDLSWQEKVDDLDDLSSCDLDDLS